MERVERNNKAMGDLKDNLLRAEAYVQAYVLAESSTDEDAPVDVDQLEPPPSEIADAILKSAVSFRPTKNGMDWDYNVPVPTDGKEDSGDTTPPDSKEDGCETPR